MQKAERELKHEIATAGLALLEFGRTGTNHYKARVGSEHGEAMVFFSCTTSDVNSVFRLRQKLRQIKRGTSSELHEPVPLSKSRR